MKLYFIYTPSRVFKGAVIHKSAPEAIKFYSSDHSFLAMEVPVKLSRNEKTPKILV